MKGRAPTHRHTHYYYRYRCKLATCRMSMTRARKQFRYWQHLGGIDLHDFWRLELLWTKSIKKKHWLCIIVFSTWVTFTSIESIIFIIFPVFCSICWIFAMQQLTLPSGNAAGSAIAAKVLSRILGHHYHLAGAVWSPSNTETIRTKIVRIEHIQTTNILTNQQKI